MTNTNNNPDTLSMLSAILQEYGPTGCEKNISQLLSSMITAPDCSVYNDTVGNLVVHRPGSGCDRKTFLFSAHMDTIGLMVSDITDQGYLRFVTLGGFVPCDLVRAQVVFPGRDAADPIYGVVVPSEEKESKAFALSDLYIDIGAADKAQAEALVSPGDCAIYAPAFFSRDQRVFSPCLDNRAGCAALVAALNAIAAPYHDLYMVFTVQEEIGMRGAKTVAFDLPADYAIAVDVTCTGDQAGSDHTATAMMGKGAAIKLMDHSVLCNRPLIAHMQAVATQHSIPWQMDIMKSGGTDAGSLQFTRSGLPTGGLSIPCRYTHTPRECIDLRDLDAVITLIQKLIESEQTP